MSGLRERFAALEPRALAAEVVKGFRQHDLLVEASAISFRVLLAVIPSLLFLFGMLGFLGLDDVWRNDIAPDVRDAVSSAAYTLIDDAVTYALTQKQLFWASIGAAIAVWEISGIVRAVAKILNRIYGVEEKRSFRELFTTSYLTGAGVGLCLLGAIAAVRLGPLAFDALFGSGLVVEIIAFVCRWAVAVVLLLVAVGLIVRTAPAIERPLYQVSFGAILVVGGWILATAIFGLYLTQIANYGSIFGNLATIFVVIEYLFLASIVMISGMLLDWIVERDA